MVIFLRCNIQVFGIVQGVGFRPFIYRLAHQFNLKGNVFNSGNEGVKITIEGEKKDIIQFIERIKNEKPEISRIDDLKINWEDNKENFTDFNILKSKKTSGDWIVLPPDISTCKDCLNDFKNQLNERFHGYPFIACSVCGPRFTTVSSMPYDRPNTTMIEFPFCKECQKEYENPLDRRFHAQTFACNTCGPQFSLFDKTGNKIDTPKPFKMVNKLISENNIIALMGIGGVHLITKTNDECVLELRKRKQKRKYKPFAIMSPSIEKIRKFAIISSEEESLLSSYRRPIVLLEKSENYQLSQHLSPGLSNIGVFLPYSGIHYLLFSDDSLDALIMTSGNISNLPMAITKQDVLSQLKNLADYFLLHNRKIYQRCDDSVIFLNNGKETIIRRSRGYVPEHFNTPFPVNDLKVIAFGPELHSTGSILKKSRIYPTQHIGDVENIETLNYLNDSINHFMQLVSMDKPDIIACDANPIFHSSKLAREKMEEYNCILLEIQHHHAHITKLMLEHSIKDNEDIIGIVLDGVGYGLDKKAWGGEILEVNYSDIKRLGHLEYQYMPAGDRCAYYPVRMLTSMLSKSISLSEIEEIIRNEYIDGLTHGDMELKSLLNQLKTNNHPQSSSMGRVLDSLSSLLKVCYERTYEGEPAIRLEHFARNGKNNLKFEVNRKSSGKIVELNTSDLILKAFKYLKDGMKKQDIAMSFIYYLTKGIANLAIELALDKGIKKIGFSGGVAHNILITKVIKNEIERSGLQFLQHTKTPPGDAGISIGQAISAVAKYSIF
ncbi:MAG: carbamoyltransferase HypF [Candidatus Lokiarchaeota archaeon]|nr:carbamoyltransferase HypF [Candidatus Lokiarchaeota archaeon]